jgi:hypothetical protein
MFDGKNMHIWQNLSLNRIIHKVLRKSTDKKFSV